MSNLTELVPPLELCKLIPAGEFEESTFCWIGKGHSAILPTDIEVEQKPFVELRRYTMQGDENPRSDFAGDTGRIAAVWQK